jgi:hypothetical protein
MMPGTRPTKGVGVQQHYVSNDVRRRVIELLESPSPSTDATAIEMLEEEGLYEAAAELEADRAGFLAQLHALGEARPTRLAD